MSCDWLYCIHFQFLDILCKKSVNRTCSLALSPGYCCTYGYMNESKNTWTNDIMNIGANIEEC